MEFNNRDLHKIYNSMDEQTIKKDDYLFAVDKDSASLFLYKLKYICDLSNGSKNILLSKLINMFFKEIISDKELLKIYIEISNDDAIFEIITKVLDSNEEIENRKEVFSYICKIIKDDNKNIDFYISYCPSYILSENIDSLLYSVDDLFSLKDKNLYPNASKKVEDVIASDEERYFKIYMKNQIGFSYKILSNEYFDKIIDVLYLMFKEICENENVPFSSIKYLTSGFFSRVFTIGDKVIKIADDRGKIVFKNNPYIVKPLLRRDIYGIFVEVTEKVDSKYNCTEEELYQLYANLRKLKLVWTDICTDNVGLLLKDNTFHWKKTITDLDEPRLLEEKVGEGITLKAGDVVILDADYIFNEDERKHIPTSKELIYDRFEARYEREKNN